MKIVGIGNLVTDYYFTDNKFIGLCGGGTTFNVLANLSNLFDTFAVGACGEDNDGEIAIRSLQDLGVNTKYVHKVKNKQTRCFNINIQSDSHVISKKKCPLCERKKWYNKDIEFLIPENFQNKNYMFVLDTLNNENIKIAKALKKSNCMLCIDIGHAGVIKNLSYPELIENLYGLFDIVQLNNRVSEYLIKKFKLENTIKLYDIFNSKLISITYGKKGAEFISKNKSYLYKLEKPTEEKDATGAGDMFLSTIIEFVAKNNFVINKSLLSKIYKEATNKTSRLVQKIGARALVQPLYSKVISEGKCICGLDIDSKETKRKTKKISSNIANLKKRIKSDFSSNAYKSICALMKELNGNSIFCGAGGSYAAAHYASNVTNSLLGILSSAYYPRDIVYKNLKCIDNIIAFSYSGTTNDILEALKFAHNQKKYIITKGKKLNYGEDYNIISYLGTKSQTSGERGFLSIEGTVFPASLFAKYLYEQENKKDSFEPFLYDRLEYWKNYFEEYFRTNNLKQIFKKGNIFDVFYGDYTTTAAIDLESKIAETGIYRATLHEKKNFSHGRFISLENYGTDAIIYLQTSDDSKYEKKLIEYLNTKNKNIILIKSPYKNLVGEFDLLIAMEYFIKNIADLINVDLSKPDYSEESMKIYKYKGKLN